MQVRAPRPAEFSLKTERLGPLPLVNHFIDRMGLAAILDKYVATSDPRCRVSHAKALGVLLRSIVVEREPIYRAQETGARLRYGPLRRRRRELEELER